MKTIKIRTEKDFTDITDYVRHFAKDKEDGAIIISSQHTTLSLRVYEPEILLLYDTLKKMEEFAPKSNNYAHDSIGIRDVPKNERINGFSHLRSLLFNTTETVMVVKGKLMLGKWQRIFAIELDGERDREIKLMHIKE